MSSRARAVRDRVAGPATPRPGPRPSAHGSSLDQVRLERSDHRQPVAQQPPDRLGRVRAPSRRAAAARCGRELRGDVPGVQQRPGQPVQLGDQGSRHRGRLPAPRAGRVGRGWCPSAPWSTSTRSVSTPSTTGRRPGRSAPVRPWTPGRNRSSVPSRHRWCRLRHPSGTTGWTGPLGRSLRLRLGPAAWLAADLVPPAGSATGQDHNGCLDRYLRHVALQVPHHLPLKVPRLDRLVAQNPRRRTRLRDTCASPPRGA